MFLDILPLCACCTLSKRFGEKSEENPLSDTKQAIWICGLDFEILCHGGTASEVVAGSTLLYDIFDSRRQH